MGSVPKVHRGLSGRSHTTEYFRYDCCKTSNYVEIAVSTEPRMSLTA